MVGLTTELSERVYGFHPSLRTTVTLSTDEVEGLKECAVGLVFAGLPGTVIVDRYQLRALYEEGRLSEPRVVPTKDGLLDLLVWTDPDLEGPASRPDPPGLGGLMVPLPLPFTGSLSILVPLHLRYLPPILDPKTDRRPVREVLIQPPSLVKWCNQSTPIASETSLPAISPDEIRLLSEFFSSPFQPLQGLPTVDAHLHPSSPIRLSVPVGVQHDEWPVLIISTAAVWLAFAWICSCLYYKKHLPIKN
ncbi:hypothetical protein PGT21_022948 [Puccinia graminis f. sp. tritici]|uniref:Protein PBN1 n=1 Tax=Puccinia graminis f. sp. tritici TaxID=56615 RepID=A0A5B0RFT3_PUCGR|nr:hypothetical protein PGT21_022948 [Puccinia graminis f. sp. tritici]KAA1124048.1 hypothetical protein PGTUg99_023737 [Puccinia graminis f. sp. tritici]